MSLKLAAGRIVVASHNAGKVREILDLLAPFGFQVKSAAELKLPEPEETGATFAENAILKARAAPGLMPMSTNSPISGSAAKPLR